MKSNAYTINYIEYCQCLLWSSKLPFTIPVLYDDRVVAYGVWPIGFVLSSDKLH